MGLYYTYVLRCSDGKLYIGCTNDINRRLKEHSSGQVASTAVRMPVELLYFEACKNQDKAFNREKYFKTGYGRGFLKDRI